jgi:hypothetical protein
MALLISVAVLTNACTEQPVAVLNIFQGLHIQRIGHRQGQAAADLINGNKALYCLQRFNGTVATTSGAIS